MTTRKTFRGGVRTRERCWCADTCVCVCVGIGMGCVACTGRGFRGSPEATEKVDVAEGEGAGAGTGAGAKPPGRMVATDIIVAELWRGFARST